LAQSKVPSGDPKIAQCLACYAKITRIDGKSKNASFETGTWKSRLAPYLKKIEAEVAKAEEIKRMETLKALKFSGSIKTSQKLLQNANKNSTVSGKSFGDILPDTKENTGKVTITKQQVSSGLTWDSLARSIFEKLGVLESKGFDVKLSCGLTYQVVKHQYLNQSFIQAVTPTCALIYNTPAAFAMKMSVTAQADIALAASAKGPSGSVIFDVVMTTPLGKEAGTVTVTFKDGNATASAKMK